VLVDPDYQESTTQRLMGYRTLLAVPMLREGRVIGVIGMFRTRVEPFDDREISLVTISADQAGIAIENARLLKDLQARNADLTEALEQQTATAEILRVISSSPTDVQPVFDAIAESSVRLCDAGFSAVHRFDGELIHLAAHRRLPPEIVTIYQRIYPRPPSRESLTARAILDGTVTHVVDAQEDPDVPEASRNFARLSESRSGLVVPMLRDGRPVGCITVARAEARPFTESQISLLKTFANQAVIAIENVRLFTELQEKNRALTEAHAQVTETLEQQTATAEILRVIASSPTDLQPVMEAVAENAARVCGATDSSIFRLEGEHLRVVARHGMARWTLRIGDTVPISRDTVVGRVAGDRRTVHVEDLMAAEAEFPATVSRIRQAGAPARTTLGTPLLREGTPLGVILINRGPEIHPFSAKQIALLETFANQAVIAIENVRLFQELRARTAELTRSVAQLTALGDVGRALSATLDVEAVLDTIVARASHLAGADACSIYEYDEGAEQFHLRATHNLDAAFVEAIRAVPLRKGEGLMGRATELRAPVQIPDITQPESYQGRVRDALIRFGYRALLSVPLLREDQIIGSLSLNRKAPGAFTREVIELLQTFATQSALAIQNARLFRRSRTRVGCSKRPAATSRSSSPTCPTSCGLR
jgi:two-component system NtrC family sensor kinase